jgi:hypothetical protein
MTITIPTDFTETTTLSAERVSITVGTYSTDRGQRRPWHYYITVEGEVAHTGDDLLASGSADEALETLTSFLTAWAESLDYTDRTGNQGECDDLFPASLYPSIGAEVDDLAALAWDRLEPTTA